MPRVEAFFAALTLFVVRLEQNHFNLACVIGHLKVEVPEAVLVQTLSLVDERLAFLEKQQLHRQRQLLEADLLRLCLLGFDKDDVLFHCELFWRLLIVRQCQCSGKFLLEFFHLRILLLFCARSLELMQNLQQVVVTLVDLLVFEICSCKPVAAHVAVDLDLRTFVLDVPLRTLEGLDTLEAGKAFDLEAETLVLDVLLEVAQVDALLHLLGITAVQNFDLADHLCEQLILDWSEDALRSHFAWGTLFLG